ncbi:hypothetical protein PTMSG1_09154 [Pyrenophora teres f. maculata]|nr:hypothetical protein PTMSG1_09154 [Pyrenophora teres f. maculata]
MSIFDNATKRAVDHNDLAVQTAKLDISGTLWLEDPTKVDQVKTLKEICLGNCRLLYGSERFKFYDIAICEDEDTKTFAAILTCNQDNETKFLRTETSSCPVQAVRVLVHGLEKDTAKLFTKYSVGSQIRGQQGATNKTTGEYELWTDAYDARLSGSNDDTQGLVRRVPTGPRGDFFNGRDRKRARAPEPFREKRMEKEGDALNYD